MKVHRVYIPEANKAFLAEQELDGTLKPTEVLIKTLYSGISAGTETARYRGLDGNIYPTASGGANVGQVVAVGEAVNEFAVGDRVASFTNHDSYVKADTQARDYGYNGHRTAVKIPPEIEASHACLIYHFAVSTAAVRESQVTLGDEVLVIGAGLIGNAAAQLFRAAGAFIMVADLSDWRLETAHACGIATTINPSKAILADEVKTWTEGRMLHHAVLAVEGAEPLQEVMPLLRQRGQVMLLGGYRRSHSLDIARILQPLQSGSRRIIAPSAWNYPNAESPNQRFTILGHFRQVLRLMQENRLKVGPLVSVVSPKDCQQVFQDLIHNKDKYLGAVFNWSDFPSTIRRWS